MIFLYTLLLILLGLVKFLIGRRVASLERKYCRVATEASHFLRQPMLKEGNSSRSDPYQIAKRQYQLGLLVQKRDRLELLHEAWQHRYEKFARAVATVRGWKGRKLPYTFGVVDVSCVLWLIDYLGAGEYLSPHRLVEVVTAYLSNG